MQIIIYLAFLVFIIDQTTKLLILYFFTVSESFPLIPQVLHITLVKNTGIAFGLLKSHTNIAHIAVGFGCILLIGMILQFTKRTRLTEIACGFMIGGALGNLVDRVRYGAVIDFIDFRIWPVFNFADTFISIAAGLFIISIMRK